MRLPFLLFYLALIVFPLRSEIALSDLPSLEDTNGVERHYELVPGTPEDFRTQRLYSSFPLTVKSEAKHRTLSRRMVARAERTSGPQPAGQQHVFSNVKGTSSCGVGCDKKSNLGLITKEMVHIASTQGALIEQLSALQRAVRQQVAFQTRPPAKAIQNSDIYSQQRFPALERPDEQLERDRRDLDVAEAQLSVAREFVSALSRRGSSPQLAREETNIRDASAQLTHARLLLQAHTRAQRSASPVIRAESAQSTVSSRVKSNQLMQSLMSKLGLVDTKNPLPVYYKKNFNDPTYSDPSQDDQIAYAPSNVLNKTHSGNNYPENFLKWNPSSSLNVDPELKTSQTMPAPPPPMPPEYPLAYPPFRSRGRDTDIATLPTSPVEGFSTVVPNSGWEMLANDRTAN